MMYLSARELISLAAGIEKSGAAYYESLAGERCDQTVRHVYEYLAGQEREHLATFETMLSPAGDYSLPDIYTEEYDNYMKSLVGSSVFTDDRVARDMAKTAGSEAEAIQIAIGAEKDSILLYLEIRELVRRSDADVLRKIIEEERSHLRQLSEIKHSLISRGA